MGIIVLRAEQQRVGSENAANHPCTFLVSIINCVPYCSSSGPTRCPVLRLLTTHNGTDEWQHMYWTRFRKSARRAMDHDSDHARRGSDIRWETIILSYSCLPWICPWHLISVILFRIFNLSGIKSTVAFHWECAAKSPFTFVDCGRNLKSDCRLRCKDVVKLQQNS